MGRVGGMQREGKRGKRKRRKMGKRKRRVNWRWEWGEKGMRKITRRRSKREGKRKKTKIRK